MAKTKVDAKWQSVMDEGTHKEESSMAYKKKNNATDGGDEMKYQQSTVCGPRTGRRLNPERANGINAA